VDFEGIDGSGKTSLANWIADNLRAQGYTVHHVRDKGTFRSEVSKEIRTVTRDPHFLRMADMTEMLLYVARDAQLVEEFIKPRLRDGAIIFSDRYFYSSIAHSHFGRGMDREAVARVIDTAAQGIWPDAVVYCDVDSLTSRVRKRVQKIHDHRFGDFGRKGLMGIGFRERMREGFLALAREDPARWCVIDNARNTFAASAGQIYAHIADALERKGFARPKPLDLEAAAVPRPSFADVSSAERQRELVERFWRTLGEMAVHQPGLAGFYTVKLDVPEAYAVRDAIVEREPEVVAYGLAGLSSPASFEYRRRLLGTAPFFVARSLRGMKRNQEAMELRKKLALREPVQVALSLRGSETPDAWGLRQRLRDDAPREVVASLRGIDSEEAWKWRRAYFKKKFYEPLAESLGGIDTDQAWEMRAAMEQKALAWVLMSLRGCRSERAWECRFKYCAKAPKIIVRTIGRRDEDRDWEIRRLCREYAKEVLDSVSGLDSERAWQLRFDLRDRWPNTAVSSLGASNHSERAWRFRWEQVQRHPENLLLVKHVVKAVIRAEEDEEGESDE
jgi:dTMP kinase